MTSVDDQDVRAGALRWSSRRGWLAHTDVQFHFRELGALPSFVELVVIVSVARNLAPTKQHLRRSEGKRAISAGCPQLVSAFEGLELSMLRVAIIGNLGSDPEQRFTKSGLTQTTFSAAVNSRRRGADGGHVERTDWFRVRTVSAKAEYVRRFTKSQRVLVIGRLEIGEWTTRAGERRTSYDIWADDVITLSQNDEMQHEGNSGPVAAGSGGGRQRPATESDQTSHQDLPF